MHRSQKKGRHFPARQKKGATALQPILENSTYKHQSLFQYKQSNDHNFTYREILKRPLKSKANITAMTRSSAERQRRLAEERERKDKENKQKHDEQRRKNNSKLNSNGKRDNQPHPENKKRQ